MKNENSVFLITKDISIKQAMRRMSDLGQKVLFIVGKNNHLVGSLSDGDIRKWILSGGSLRESVYKICNRKPRFVREAYELDKARQMMLDFAINSIPVLNDADQLLSVLTWADVFSAKVPKKKKHIDIQVVIMAGGKGSRLDPFTKILPKPLIPINDKPIIEVIMDKFNEYGIDKFFVSLNHKAKMIKSYFEDSDFKYDIRYVEENLPLGTAGSLRLLKNKVREPFLVTNCDVIIETDYDEIINFHKENNNDITLVVSCKHYVIPYGVCNIENGGILKNIDEKPEHDLLINTGMYIMQKNVLGLIPRNKLFNINELLMKAKGKGYRIGVFPVSESAWIDVGQWEEYHKAIEKMKLK
jgi:dTDP-glucose pyrophosphorylase